MEVKVIHHTIDLLPMDGIDNATLADQATIVGGREAGICYMADNYFSDKINRADLAVKRANTIIASGHHSPFDHYSIGFEISGIPKILAMMLNSTEMYTTSEKSGRYTKMHPETVLEMETYEKWVEIFKRRINEEYNENPNSGAKIDSKTVEKLALENARYMLSVFTPTSMGYTTTFRQLSYMHCWCLKLIENIKNNPDPFGKKLIPYLNELDCKMLAPYSNNGAILDKKNGGFNFFRLQNGLKPWNKDNGVYTDVYTDVHYSSFTCLAQEHRHRTIHYEMEFNGVADKCFIPPIIADDKELRDEWVKDFEKLRDYFPQCTLVKVIEQGRTADFIAKCKERLCGRAQLEIMMGTVKLAEKMLDNYDNMSSDIQEQLDSCFADGVCTKCKFNGYTCTEPCTWGAKYGLTRKI